MRLRIHSRVPGDPAEVSGADSGPGGREVLLRGGRRQLFVAGESWFF